MPEAAFERLLKELRKSSPEARGLSSVLWGAKHNEFRQLIRASIVASFAADRLADLSSPPRLPEWSITVSHTSDLGGWMALPRPLQIGWDVETRSRINDKVVQRVSSVDELSSTPQPHFLWSAKESYFKALESHQPKTVEPLRIDSWRPSPANDMWSWRGRGPLDGQGLLIETTNWTLAVCVVKLGR